MTSADSLLGGRSIVSWVCAIWFDARLDGLLAVLGLVDRLELTQRSEKDQVHFKLRMQTALPLRRVQKLRSKSGVPMKC